MSTGELRGRAAIVTGAAAGIGLTYAAALAGEGVSVAIADIDLPRAEDAAAELRASGGDVHAVHVDMGDAASIEAMAETALATAGRIDILVNNAGRHLHTYARPCAQIDIGLWRELLDVNITGPLLAVRACVPAMREIGGGVVVNQSSAAAFSATTSYGVSKAALISLTTALAHELAADGIRVNAIAPGLVDSPAAMEELPEEFKDSVIARQAIDRLGRMDDLVSALLYLCGDGSSFMTGQTLVIDGGITLRP